LLLAVALRATACFAEDLPTLYERDYESFFNRWTLSSERAAQCTDIAETARFLDDALYMLGNAEVTEANAEFIETLAVEQPRCFLDALAALPRARQRQMMGFLVLPLFADADGLAAALSPYWTDGRHRPLFDQYLEAREDWRRFEQSIESREAVPE